jgi:hypothetical protein
MLRLLGGLVRVVRRNAPGGRGRLTYRALQAVVAPEPALMPARRIPDHVRDKRSGDRG